MQQIIDASLTSEEQKHSKLPEVVEKYLYEGKVVYHEMDTDGNETIIYTQDSNISTGFIMMQGEWEGSIFDYQEVYISEKMAKAIMGKLN